MTAYRQFTAPELLNMLMQAVEEKDNSLHMRPDGRAGIANGNDRFARRWQRYDDRVRKLHQELRERLEATETKTAVKELGV